MEYEKLIRAIAIVVVVVIWLFAVNSYAQFGGGNGSAATPWQVSSVEHLLQLRHYIGVGHNNKHFIQTANIDVAGIANWEPVSNAANNRFHGKYNGDDFEIRNLRRSIRLANFGFFGYCGNGCVLENIKIRDTDITVNGHSGIFACQTTGTEIRNCSATGIIRTLNVIQGGLVGTFADNGNIHRCWVDITMIDGGSGGRAGGLVGDFTSAGSITESFAIFDLTWRGDNPPCGGLVAKTTAGSISNCYAIGIVREVEARGRIGGFVGDNLNQLITDCYAIVRIETDSPNPIGGFIAQGTVDNVISCYWNPELTGVANSPGGGEPLITAQMLDRDSFVNWDFEGDNPIWRIDQNSIPYLAWEGEEAPEHCRPPTTLPPSSLTATLQADVVRLTWERPSIIRPLGYNVYRNSRQINQNLIEEEEYQDGTVELYNIYNYYATAVYDDDIESIPSNALSIVFHDLDGEGTSNNPYLIRNATHLNAVRLFDGGHFRQAADIDLGVPPWNQGEGWKPIGLAPPDEFKGTYDGNGFIISSLTINTNASCVGLFGYINAATLRNIILEDVNVLRGGEYNGPLVARTFGGTITNCSSHGEVNGIGNKTGGLIGYTSGTEIIDCHSSATVNAPNSDIVGGLIADSWGEGIRCWATGDVTGRDYVGGFAGREYNYHPAYQQIYATGRVVGNNEVGGLFGFIQTASYNDMYATGDVVGVSKVGGLIGNHNLDTADVVNCYSIGRVTGNNDVGGLIGHVRVGGGTLHCYWNTTTSGQHESASGNARDERQMRYPYGENTYIGWNFNTVWAHDINPSWNGGYPRFQFQEQPADLPGAPVVKADIVRIDGTDHFRIRWEPVEGARSYKIFASYDPMGTNWGDPIRVVGEDVTVFTEAVGDRIERYYYIVASKRSPL